MPKTEAWSTSEYAPRSPAISSSARMFLFAGLSGLIAAALGGCAQEPVYQRAASQSKEYFPGSIYGKPSPRVVAYGEPVPRGGGFYMVGKPYSVAGQMYVPTEKQRATIGLASWYGEAFHGRRTANGEVYDCDAITAAHPTMPLPSYARVTNLENHNSVIVRVNDRGPFHPNRVVDVSRKTAQVLDFHGSGTTKVKIEYIAPAGLAGSDDMKLLATLKTNGPAVLAAKESTPNLELASSSSGDASNAELPIGVEAPTPPVREARTESTANSDQKKIVALGAETPLPPIRPYAGKARPYGGGTTQVARASSDKTNPER
jgi:rare lipoprotein A